MGRIAVKSNAPRLDWAFVAGFWSGDVFGILAQSASGSRSALSALLQLLAGEGCFCRHSGRGVRMSLVLVLLVLGQLGLGCGWRLPP